MAEFPTCDRCGKPVDPSKGRYTIADEYDKDDNWITSRHIECTANHKFADASKRFDEALARAKDILAELRSKR